MRLNKESGNEQILLRRVPASQNGANLLMVLDKMVSHSVSAPNR